MTRIKNKGNFLAERILDIGTEAAFEASALAKSLEAEGKSIINFEIGEPVCHTRPYC
ncbi:MAG: hypothetical protein QXX95_03930 [Nitrososphaerales archaeon]